MTSHMIQPVSHVISCIILHNNSGWHRLFSHMIQLVSHVIGVLQFMVQTSPWRCLFGGVVTPPTGITSSVCLI